MNFESIMLNEINQTQEGKYYDSTQGVVKFIETGSRMVVARGWGKRMSGELVLLNGRVSVGEDDNVLEMVDGNGCTTK